MKREHLLVALFMVIAAVFVYLFYQIMVPFFVPIIWAAILAILFYPPYSWVLGKVKRKGLASIIMCILIVIVIIGPATYLFVALVNEAGDAVREVNAMYRSGELDEILSFRIPGIDTLRDKLGQYYDLSNFNLEDLIKDAIDKVSSVILNQTSWLIANGTKAVFFFILMVFTLYFFFKDGESIIRRIKRLMPLTINQTNVTFGQLRDVIQATMYGAVVVALVQGVLGGVLFALVGIPSAVFWGAIMAFLSVLPMVGAFIVYVPAGIILILSGSYIKGIIILFAGTVIISQIDNVLRPLLIAGRTSMHPLMLFFAVMGGIAVFGLLGVVLGPLVAAAFITLLKILEFRLHPDASAGLGAGQEP
ncbi:AI-2E family transporter [candidate division GN15 bacterium]|nr:AI-2E family transporter [candidate division GN15 bacterium]